jgi:copper chaperone CopZ
MRTRTMKIQQTNMYCQKCFHNVIRALSNIDTIEFLDIDMINKNIKIKYKDSDLNNNGIRYLINKAITTGK